MSDKLLLSNLRISDSELAGEIANLERLRLNPLGLSTREAYILLALYELSNRRAFSGNSSAPEMSMHPAAQTLRDLANDCPEGDMVSFSRAALRAMSDSIDRRPSEETSPRREYHANGTYWNGVPTVDIPCDFCLRPIIDHDPRTHACPPKTPRMASALILHADDCPALGRADHTGCICQGRARKATAQPYWLCCGSTIYTEHRAPCECGPKHQMRWGTSSEHSAWQLSRKVTCECTNRLGFFIRGGRNYCSDCQLLVNGKTHDGNSTTAM